MMFDVHGVNFLVPSRYSVLCFVHLRSLLEEEDRIYTVVRTRRDQPITIGSMRGTILTRFVPSEVAGITSRLIPYCLVEHVVYPHVAACLLVTLRCCMIKGH